MDIHSSLRPDPNEQSAALLRAILLTLNQSTGETPVIPPVREGPSSEVVTATCLMYASLVISLLAAFIAMLGKQWLNRYKRNAGGSIIDRCGDRQRKCDGLEKWSLNFFIESLPLMLQAALLLLACGLCRHMWSINASVAYTLISLIGLGVAFFVAIVIAGASSYACPFQTPASVALRGSWKSVRRGVLSSGGYFKRALSPIVRMLKRRLWPSPRRPPPQIEVPLENVQVRESEPWPKPEDLATIHTTNTNDAGCASWIIRNITDPEALNAAIRLAGTIRWFDDGANPDVPYDSIVSTFKACFDPSGKLYTKSRDTAYYSGRAIVWIHVLAKCKSKAFGCMFPIPGVKTEELGLDHDLTQLLDVKYSLRHDEQRVARLLVVDPEHTPSHMEWASDVLLHFSWATQDVVPNYAAALPSIPDKDNSKAIIPPNVRLNRLLVWSTFLGLPVTEEVLKVQNKLCDAP